MFMDRYFRCNQVVGCVRFDGVIVMSLYLADVVVRLASLSKDLQLTSGRFRGLY